MRCLQCVRRECDNTAIRNKGSDEMKAMFLHGLGQDSSVWKQVLDNIDNHTDALCPDLSTWLMNKQTCYLSLYQELERQCAKLPKPMDLCGISLGGILAMQYAIEHKDEVHSLVLIATQYTMPKGLLKLQNILFHFMPRAAFTSMGFQKKNFIQLCKSMIDLDFCDSLAMLTCPILIVCGEKDRANKKVAIQLQARIPHAKLVIIADVGHEVNVDAPIELGKEIKDFYEEVRSKERSDTICI